LSSPDDIVTEDNQVPYIIPPPPPAPEDINISGNSSISEQSAADRDFSGGLTDDATEEQIATVQPQPTTQKDSEYAPVTMEALNAQWLRYFVNPFATFVEETLQSCSESDNVESTLWPDLMTFSQAVGSDTCAANILPPLVPIRVASVNSAAIPDTGPSFDDGTLPAEAGIEVRPMKSR
jgi:hypothetical protein